MARRRLWVIELRDREPREPDMLRRPDWEPCDRAFMTRQKARDGRPTWRRMGYETRVRDYGPRGQG